MARLPISNYITSYKNYKDSAYKAQFGITHYGTDFAAPIGTTVVAPIGGYLYRIPASYGFNGAGAGPYALVLYADDGTMHFFAHLSSNIIDYGDGYGGIKNGSYVKEGQTIGKTGNEGYSTGPHLHWQVVTRQSEHAFRDDWFPKGKPDYTIDPFKWLNGPHPKNTHSEPTHVDNERKWRQDSKGWWYGNSQKWYASQWAKIDGKWYYFDSHGYAVKNQWVETDGKRYYLGDDFAMVTNSMISVDNTKYNLDKDGDSSTVDNSCCN